MFENDSNVCLGTRRKHYRHHALSGLAKVTLVALVYCCTELKMFPNKAYGDEQHLRDSYPNRVTSRTELGATVIIDTTYEDGSIKTKSVDSKEVDQRYVASIFTSVVGMVTPKLSVRSAMGGLLRDGLKQDTVSTSRKVTVKSYEAAASLDVGLKVNTDIEIVFGLGVLHLPKSNKTIKSDSLRSEEKAQAITFYSPRFSILKLSNLFTAGIYFQKGSEKKRNLERTTELTTESSKKFETIPNEIGLTGRFWLGSNTQLNGELALVQLTISEEKTEEGSPLNKDYFRMQFGLGQTLLPNFLTLGASISHHTSSYSDQGFMSFENIAKTRIDSKIQLNSFPLNPGFGLGFEIAQDKQSTQELNADFLWLAYSLNFSLGQNL